MPENNSRYPRDWFERGRADIQAAEILLKHRGDIGVAAVLIQQAVEKYLKGFLLSRGWRLRKIHDLEVLLNEAVVHNREFEPFRDLCLLANQFFADQRYPGVASSGPGKRDVTEALTRAKELTAQIDRLT